MDADASRWPIRGLIAALALAALATASVSLWTIDHLKDAVVDAALHGRTVTFRLVFGSAGAPDVALIGAAFVSVCAVFWLQIRHRLVSSFLSTATGAEAFVVLTILVAWFGHSYLAPGVLLGGDTGTHIARFLEMQRGLNAGTLPDWTNYQYMGEPLLWFTGPLTYVVGGVLAWLLQDPTEAAKILLFSLHMTSGWLYFAFLRRLGCGVIGAMLVAACFAGCFAHLHLFLYRGVFPQAFTIAFLVALFYAADGLLRGVGARWANGAIFALCTAGLILNHQPHALFSALYLLAFGLVALSLGVWQRDNLPVLVMAGVLGVVTSVVAVLPTMTEANWVMIEADGFPFHLHLPTAHRLLHLVLWRDTRTTWGTDYWAYLGVGLIGFGLAGLAAMLHGNLDRRERPLGLSAGVALALCFFLYNSVVRDILYLMFFLGIVGAIGFDWLLRAGYLRGQRLVWVVLIVVVDLMSTSVQPVARTDKGFLMAAGQALEREAPGQRVIELGVDGDGTMAGDIGPDAGAASYAATFQRMAGNHNMAATRVHNYDISLVRMADAELNRDGALQSRIRKLLAVFNVGRLVCSTATAMGCPASLRDTVEDPVLGRYLRIDHATPVLFSQVLRIFDADPSLEKPMLWPSDFAVKPIEDRIVRVDEALGRFLDVEDIDLSTRQAGAIALHSSQAAAPGPPAGSKPWTPMLLDYAVSLESVRARVSTQGCGYVQLAHPWFPSTVVTVNGKPLRPLRGALNFMVVPVCDGISVIELRPGWTFVRAASAVTSLLGLVMLGVWAGWLARRDRGLRSEAVSDT